MQRMLVTGPPGIALELCVPQGTSLPQLQSIYKATLMRREARRGSELAVDVAKRMDEADEDRVRQARSPNELVEEWEKIVSEVRGRDLTEGEGPCVVFRAVRGLAQALGDAGRLAEAIPKWEEALSIRESMQEENKTQLVESMAAPARACRGDLESTLRHHRAALDIAKAPGSGVEYTHVTALNKDCGVVAMQLQRFDEALPFLQEAYRRSHSSEPPHGPQCRDCSVCRGHTENLGQCLVFLHKYEEAIPFLEEVVDIQTRVRDYENLMFNLERLGLCLDLTGSTERAIQAFQMGLDLTRRLNTGPMDLGAAAATVGKTLMKANRFQEAVPLLEEATSLLASALGPTHPHLDSMRAMVQAAKDGASQQTQAQTEGGAAEALDYPRMSIRELKRVLTERGVDLSGLVERDDLVRACQESEGLDEAVE